MSKISLKKILVSVAILFTVIITINCHRKTEEEKEMIRLEKLTMKLTEAFDILEPMVIQPAEGYLKYPYLIPAGFYKQMWDWDGFFIANHFLQEGKPEYLKYWALNLIEGIDEEGYVSGCATTESPRQLFGKFAMKPFLSQGVYLAAEALNDYSWVELYYDKLMKVLEYRDRTQLDSLYNLYFWDNGMQSGADNNPSINYLPEDTRSFLAPDASAFQLMEILAQANIAKKLDKKVDYMMLQQKAMKLLNSINKHLWSKDDKIYYSIDRSTGAFNRCVSYSCFVPLIAKIPSVENACEMINKYLLDPEHLKSDYGFRSLSKQDPSYNNENIIKPFSNWQGPVWPIANYLYSIALHNYGYDNEVKWLAATVGQLLLDDIKSCGRMHENYDAQTGAPLAPSADYVDADGKFVGFIGWNLCIQNVLEGVVYNKWMLLL